MDAHKRSRLRHPYLWGGLALGVIVGAGALVGAAVPHTFKDGDTLAAADLNGNLTALDQRIATLEAQAHPASAFEAWLTTAGPTLTNAATVVISFDHVEFDLGSEYNPSTGIFSPKQGGVYLLGCSAWFDASGPGVFVARLENNGIAQANELSGDDAQAYTGSAGISSETTNVVKLAAGDMVTCSFYLTGGSQTVSSGLPRRNRFYAARIY